MTYYTGLDVSLRLPPALSVPTTSLKGRAPKANSIVLTIRMRMLVSYHMVNVGRIHRVGRLSHPRQPAASRSGCASRWRWPSAATFASCVTCPWSSTIQIETERGIALGRRTVEC